MPTRTLILPLRTFLRVIAAVVLLAAAGCQSVSVNRLREAQDSFNAAAGLENRAQLAPTLGTLDAEKQLTTQLEMPVDELLVSATKMRTGYAAALASLKQIDASERAQLEKDKLWGAALCLRAMTEWKLGLYDEALQSADEAGKVQEQLFPRDAALVAALPGLIKIDLAYATIAALPYGPTRDEQSLVVLQRRLVGKPGETEDGSAVDDLRQARKKAGPLHPVTVYLIECQLAAFRNYQIAYQRTHGRPLPLEDPAMIEAGRNLAELDKFLRDGKAPTLAQARISFWKNNYNIVPAPR